jgi:hypothetical protein
MVAVGRSGLNVGNGNATVAPGILPSMVGAPSG